MRTVGQMEDPFGGGTLAVELGTFPRPGHWPLLLADGHWRLSVNLEESPPAGMVAVKDWSENVGVLDALVSAGIVSKPEDYIPSGHVRIPVCRLLVPSPAVSEVPTRWAIICPNHERVFLTYDEYVRQLCNADTLWHCPLCKEAAWFDDETHVNGLVERAGSPAA